MQQVYKRSSFLGGGRDVALKLLTLSKSKISKEPFKMQKPELKVIDKPFPQHFRRVESQTHPGMRMITFSGPYEVSVVDCTTGRFCQFSIPEGIEGDSDMRYHIATHTPMRLIQFEVIPQSGVITYNSLIEDFPVETLISAIGKAPFAGLLTYDSSMNTVILKANTIKPQVFQTIAIWLWYIYKSEDEAIHELILPYSTQALWDFCQAFERLDIKTSVLEIHDSLAKMIWRRPIPAPLYMELFRHFRPFKSSKADVFSQKVHRALIRAPGMQAAKAKTPYFAEVTEKLRVENGVAYLEVMEGYQKSIVRVSSRCVSGKEGKKRAKGPEDHDSSTTHSGSDSSV
jgi:hypothetical protein